MFRNFRQLLQRTVRAGLLLAVALSIPLQGMLGFLSGLHEATAHANSTNIHLSHAVSHAEETADDAHEDMDGALHLLVHHVHCCGHAFGLAATELDAPLVVAASIRPLPRVSAPMATTRLTNPFRPPIQV